MKLTDLDLDKTFVTSDHHFFSWKLPIFKVFSEKEEAELVKKWNSVVNPDDVVIYVGDFSDGNAKDMIDILRMLHGRIILVKGNHDYLPDTFYQCVFDKIADNLEFEADGLKFFVTHAPADNLSEMKQIFGHAHRGLETQPKMQDGFCACVQFSDGYPVRLRKVIESFKQQTSAEVS